MYLKKIFIAVFVLFYFALFLSCEHVHFNSMYGGWRMGEMGGGGGSVYSLIRRTFAEFALNLTLEKNDGRCKA